jgi:hypothetical protein
MFLLLLGLTTAADPQAPADPHLRANPVYEKLCQTGLKVNGMQAKLPLPTFASDEPAEQKATLRKLAGDMYDLDELTRNSVVAPYILKINELKDPNAKDGQPRDNCYQLDLWFVAHSSLDKFDAKDMEKRLIQLSRGDIAIQLLKAEELKARGIRAPESDHERYSHSSYTLLDRVELKMTTRQFWSQTDKSVLLAGQSDERFLKDKMYPNQWRSIDKTEDPPKLGPVEPYAHTIGSYQKVMKLAEPPGALLIEYHGIFIEPAGWFRGTNLLRSKLPLLIQSEVRTFRREVAAKPK